MTRTYSIPALALAVLAAGGPAAQAQTGNLTSYEATYKLSLAESGFKGAVVTAKGVMATRIKRDCARWQSQNEFLFLLELDNGDKIRTHTMFRQRESLNGQSIDFAYWQDLSGAGRMEYTGTATIPASGEAGLVRYEKPKRLERKLPKGVEMPITALREIVDSLITDGTAPKHNYFDPQAKFVEVRNIGGDPIILAVPPKGDAGLVDGRSWRLRATPIPEGEEEEAEKDEELKEKKEETYTMMQIHDSGVASFMVLKTGKMTINAELVEVKQLPMPSCAGPIRPEKEEPGDLLTDCLERRPEDQAPVAADAGASGPEAKDCAVTIEKDNSVEADGIQAAPVEDVETEPAGDGNEALAPADGSDDPLLTEASVKN